MADASVNPTADAEYQAALAWYFARSPQAGAGFESTVAEALRSVGDFPELYAFVVRDRRRCPLGRYPYGLIYYIMDDGRVRVIALIHDRQTGTNWAGCV